MDVFSESRRYNEHMCVCKNILNKMKLLLDFNDLPHEIDNDIRKRRSSEELESITADLLRIKIQNSTKKLINMQKSKNNPNKKSSSNINSLKIIDTNTKKINENGIKKITPKPEWKFESLPYCASFMSLALTANELEDVESKVNKVYVDQTQTCKEKYQILRSVFFKEKVNNLNIENTCTCVSPTCWTKNLNFDSNNLPSEISSEATSVLPQKNYTFGTTTFFAMPIKVCKDCNADEFSEDSDEDIQSDVYKNVSVNTSELKYRKISKKRDDNDSACNKQTLEIKETRDSQKQCTRKSISTLKNSGKSSQIFYEPSLGSLPYENSSLKDKEIQRKETKYNKTIIITTEEETSKQLNNKFKDNSENSNANNIQKIRAKTPDTKVIRGAQPEQNIKLNCHCNKKTQFNEVSNEQNENNIVQYNTKIKNKCACSKDKICHKVLHKQNKNDIATLKGNNTETRIIKSYNEDKYLHDESQEQSENDIRKSKVKLETKYYEKYENNKYSKPVNAKESFKSETHSELQIVISYEEDTPKQSKEKADVIINCPKIKSCQEEKCCSSVIKKQMNKSNEQIIKTQNTTLTENISDDDYDTVDETTADDLTEEDIEDDLIMEEEKFEHKYEKVGTKYRTIEVNHSMKTKERIQKESKNSNSEIMEKKSPAKIKCTDEKICGKEKCNPQKCSPEKCILPEHERNIKPKESPRKSFEITEEEPRLKDAELSEKLHQIEDEKKTERKVTPKESEKSNVTTEIKSPRTSIEKAQEKTRSKDEESSKNLHQINEEKKPEQKEKKIERKVTPKESKKSNASTQMQSPKKSIDKTEENTRSKDEEKLHGIEKEKKIEQKVTPKESVKSNGIIEIKPPKKSSEKSREKTRPKDGESSEKLQKNKEEKQTERKEDKLEPKIMTKETNLSTEEKSPKKTIEKTKERKKSKDGDSGEKIHHTEEETKLEQRIKPKESEKSRGSFIDKQSQTKENKDSENKNTPKSSCIIPEKVCYNEENNESEDHSKKLNVRIRATCSKEFINCVVDNCVDLDKIRQVKKNANIPEDENTKMKGTEEKIKSEQSYDTIPEKVPNTEVKEQSKIDEKTKSQEAKVPNIVITESDSPANQTKKSKSKPSKDSKKSSVINPENEKEKSNSVIEPLSTKVDEESKKKDKHAWALAYVKLEKDGAKLVEILHTSPDEPGRYLIKDDNELILFGPHPSEFKIQSTSKKSSK